MVKILWVSRHTMTTEQIADLQRIYGDVGDQTVRRQC